MPTPEILEKLCFDEKGGLKSKQDARASMINHLILEDTLDIDDAEDTADRFMRECGHWPELNIKIVLDEEEAGHV